MFDELCLSTNALAQASGIFLHSQNSLEGSARIQKDHLLRALGNVVQNAIEHTPEGGSVYLEGCMLANGWQITVTKVLASAGPRCTMRQNACGVMIRRGVLTDTMDSGFGSQRRWLQRTVDSWN